VALQAVTPRETRGFGGEPRENVLVGAGSSCPRQIRTRWTSVQGFTRPGQPGRARCGRPSPGAPGSPPGPSHEPATEGVRVKRIGVAPLLSRAIVKARRRIGPKPIRPLISQQPGWSLLPKRRLHPCKATRATSAQQRGARSIRGRARGSYSIATVVGPPHPRPRLLGPQKPPSLARRRQKVARRTNRRRLVLLRAARDTRGQKQVHAPDRGRKRRSSGCAARKVPRSRALTGSGRACSPGDQGHAWIGGSPGCVVKRSLERRTS